MNKEKRYCGNCLFAKTDGDRLKCNLIPEQRSMVAQEDGSVHTSDFCPQHEFVDES